MAERRKLPLGIQNFAEIIEQGYLYIDKTPLLHRLVTEGKLYFLSRPRRFGKSVLISTLASLFEGRQELFRGLYLENRWEWQPYPVLQLSLLGIKSNAEVSLEKGISLRLDRLADRYGVCLTADACSDRFYQLIDGMSQHGRVVILIDEYDKPILDQLNHPEQAARNKDFLATFYAVIKSLEHKLAFVFLTGVSKFTRVSIFSELNNLTDITLSETYAGIAGYTETEMERDLLPYLPEEVLGIRGEALVEAVRSWYNGYSWDGKTRVYNPVSVLNFLREKNFRPYWFATGTPKFLIKLLQERNVPIQDMEDITLNQQILDSFEPERIVPEVLFFQTGYLTIKEIIHARMQTYYRLGYPNKEVKEAFLHFILAEYANNTTLPGTLVMNLGNSICEGDLQAFCTVLQQLFATIPYNMFVAEREGYYHTIIYLALSLLGLDIRCEVQTNTGRIDAIIETGDRIYILEFKLGTAEDALTQIRNKQYAAPYMNQGKQVIIAGIGIDPEARNISEWREEPA